MEEKDRDTEREGMGEKKEERVKETQETKGDDRSEAHKAGRGQATLIAWTDCN